MVTWTKVWGSCPYKRYTADSKGVKFYSPRLRVIHLV